MMPSVLTVAGLDPSGGAGIAADLKTFLRHGVHGLAVASCLTEQNFSKVFRVHAVPAETLRGQLVPLFSELKVETLKTGALASGENVKVLSEIIADHANTKLIIDPVMVSSSGADLLEESARWEMAETLFPRCDVVTPNAHEAKWLAGFEVLDAASAKRAGDAIRRRFGCPAVLIKGGHTKTPVDVLCLKQQTIAFSAPRIAGASGHGTGCMLASAIAANRAQGLTLVESVRQAKAYVHRALAQSIELAMNHGQAAQSLLDFHEKEASVVAIKVTTL